MSFSKLCFITSSSSAIFGAAGLAAYSTSKHALKGLTEALSVEFSIIDSRAADAQPGLIKTGMMPDGSEDFLPKEGPFRVLPAKAVADAVWASYHDTTGKLHWLPVILFASAFIASWFIDTVRLHAKIPKWLLNCLSVLYFLFFIVDFILLSRSFMVAVIHLILFASIVKLLTQARFALLR